MLPRTLIPGTPLELDQALELALIILVDAAGVAGIEADTGVDIGADTEEAGVVDVGFATCNKKPVSVKANRLFS